MSRVNSLTFFDNTKELVIAQNGVLPIYNGMRLQNVKPANTKFSFYTANNSHLSWLENGHQKCEVTHTMNCYPIVSVLNNLGEQLYPTINVVDGQTFTMDFGCELEISQDAPWICIITYASEYGNAEIIATELTNNLLESQQYAAAASEAATQAIVARDSAASYLPQMQALFDVLTNPDIIVIPSSTTAYTLDDETSVERGHAWHYYHAPNATTTYTLPDVASANTAHELLLDIDCTNCQNFLFVDANGDIIELQNDILVRQCDKYRMICIYQFGIWSIFPMQIKVVYITASVEETISGTHGTAIADTQLTAIASNSDVVTFDNTTPFPAGITMTSSGLITGTPSNSGTTETIVKVTCKYATPVEITVTFNIA